MPDYQRGIEQPARLQIGEQIRNGLPDRTYPDCIMVGLGGCQSAVGIVRAAES
jgi:hypothetical protein